MSKLVDGTDFIVFALLSLLLAFTLSEDDREKVWSLKNLKRDELIDFLASGR